MVRQNVSIVESRSQMLIGCARLPARCEFVIASRHRLDRLPLCIHSPRGIVPSHVCVPLPDCTQATHGLVHNDEEEFKVDVVAAAGMYLA